MEKRGRPVGKKGQPNINAMSNDTFVSHLEGMDSLPPKDRERYQKRVNEIHDNTYERACRLLEGILSCRNWPSGRVF